MLLKTKIVRVFLTMIKTEFQAEFRPKAASYQLKWTIKVNEYGLQAQKIKGFTASKFSGPEKQGCGGEGGTLEKITNHG